ncbi:Zinc- or iron-chelating domain-containing protein [Candidatus Magnetomoraceae bacterium gMMP-15]
MKTVKIEDIDKLPGRKLEPDETFCFRCHAGLDCFNKCCRNLNLFLYPYDVLRLKQRLNISSDEFSDKYTDVVLRPGNFFPDVLLKMADNEEHTCPFLCEEGCSVYADRPDTCRSFPVEQGLMYDSATNKSKPVYFFRPPDFCLGQNETKKWTTKTWASDQEAILYNKMTAQWAELKGLFSSDPWGKEGPYGARGKMAFMAVYNIDMFREFIFKSSFLKRYKVKNILLKKIKADDFELMNFAFAWLKFYLWGIKSKIIRMR